MKSARLLGLDYGVNAQEMNRILVHLGMLEGKPGNYFPTERAEEYVKEKYEHRGCGGYPSYNRYWTERSYNESIKEILDAEITPELIDLVREENREARRIKKEAQVASEEFCPSLLNSEEHNDSFIHTIIDNLDEKSVIGAGAILIGTAVVCKAIPYIKRWWKGIWENDKVESDK